MPPQKSISIIGAGIAGLTLGRALLKHGIRATIYERKAASSKHSYAITLYPSAYRRLLEVLGLNEADFKRRVAVPVSGGKIDAGLLANPVMAPVGAFKAHRGRLEDLLREELDVRWEHGVEKVERTADGVVAHLSQEGPLRDTLLIGADGPHSKVRVGLLPNIELTVLPYVAFNGKRRVPLSTFTEHYAPAFSASTILEKKVNDAVLSLSIFDKTEDNDNISLSWIYSRPARGSSDVLHRPERSTTDAKETPAGFFEEIEGLGDLAQPCRDIFDVAKLRKDRILHWLMRTVEIRTSDLTGLAKEDVLLIGDAAHAEPILGGEGANNAIVEAIELADALSRDEHLVDWIGSRTDRWEKGVSESKTRIAQMHGSREANL